MNCIKPNWAMQQNIVLVIFIEAMLAGALIAGGFMVNPVAFILALPVVGEGVYDAVVCRQKIKDADSIPIEYDMPKAEQS